MEFAKDFQKEVIRSILHDKPDSGVMICLPTGLGKTYISLMVLLAKMKELKRSRCLIITPATNRNRWQDEVKEWTGLDVKIHEETKKVCLNAADVMITSYESARTRDLTAFPWDFLILDESHKIKDHKSDTYKTISKLSRSIKYCMLLTATPTPNAVYELYTQIDLCKPGIVGDWISFIKTYCDGHWDQSINGWQYKGHDMRTLPKLKQIFDSVKVIAKRDDCLDVPKRIRVRVNIPVEDVTNIQLARRRLVKLGQGQKNRKIAMEMNQLVLQLNRESTSLKMNNCILWIQSLLERDSEQLIIFVENLKFADRLESWLKESTSYSFIVIHSEKNQTKSQRHKLTTEFQRGLHRVAVLGLLGCNAGINMTPCFRSVYLQFHFVPGILTQAEGRTDRIGAVRRTEHYYLVGCGTYDDCSLVKISNKNDVVNKLNGTEDDRNFDREINFYPGTKIWWDELCGLPMTRFQGKKVPGETLIQFIIREATPVTSVKQTNAPIVEVVGELDGQYALYDTIHSIGGMEESDEAIGIICYFIPCRKRLKLSAYPNIS